MKLTVLKSILLPLSVLILFACRKDPVPDPSGFKLRIETSAAGSTRVTGDALENESRVSDLQVLVFDRDGNLEVSGSARSSSLSLSCRGGEKTVWALVNAPSANQVLCLADLSAVLSNLSDNEPGRLVMAGSCPLSVRSDQAVAIEVERLCAKVTVGKITRAFTSPVLQAKPLTVHRIYMTNVAADRPLIALAPPSAWLNRMGERGDCPGLLCDTVERELVSSLEETHTFYVYPNDAVSGARGGTWSPRPTRLVIDTTLDGDRYYYVIDIPDIQSNHSYRLTDIVLGRPGSTDEENVSSEAAVRFTFSVVGWNEMDPCQENL